MVNNKSVANTHTQLFYCPFSRTTRVSLCQKKTSSGLYGAREDDRGRHTDNPTGCHSIRTNQIPTSNIPSPFLCQMPFLLQPSQFILAWDRHRTCWLAYPVAWFNDWSVSQICPVNLLNCFSDEIRSVTCNMLVRPMWWTVFFVNSDDYSDENDESCLI